MKLILLFKTLLILATLGIILRSCKKSESDEKTDIHIDKVIVNNSGDFNFKDSLILLVNDAMEYQIKFATTPQNADIYYSKNANDFEQLTEDWIVIDSTYKSFQFYADGQHYNKTDNYELNFGFGNDSIISSADLYPNPFSDSLKYEFETKNIRGEYAFIITKLNGQRILTLNDFIMEDNLKNRIDVDSIETGVYVCTFIFGNQLSVQKIIKK